MSDRASFLWVDDEPSDGSSSVLRPPAATGTTAVVRTDGLPAEPGLWIFVLGDMAIFGVFFTAFLAENRGARSEFTAAADELYPAIGVANTLVLLASSLLVVLALHYHRQGATVAARRLILGALACAGTFAGIKAVEYSLEISAGHTPTSGGFFTFYFVMTGVHLVHVLIGAAWLTAWSRRVTAGRPWRQERRFAESAAVYWHMVDLLWIIIFTLLYLVCAS